MGFKKTAQKVQGVMRKAAQDLMFDSIAKDIASTGPIEDIEQVFNKGARGFHGLISPIQSREELIPVLKLLKKEAIKTVMEIGTARGGTLFMLTRVVDPNAKIISLDLPGGAFGGGYDEKRIPVYKSFALPTQSMNLVRADSHKEESRDEIARVLNGDQIDFILIDGDHTYDGVKQDFEMYTPFVRKGGLIGFHDIVYAKGVKRFWEEVSVQFDESHEFVAQTGRQLGIGLVRKEQ